MAVLLLTPVGTASATTFNVNTTTDGVHGSCGTTPGSCSLRDAVIAANGGSGGDTIDVPAGTYDLTIVGSGEDSAATGDLDITKSVTLAGAGPGSGGTMVKGEGDRVFDIFGGASAVTISGIAITNGAENFGGAINTVGASLTLTGDSFTQNTATSVGFGGAIFMEPPGAGTLTITDCTFGSNTAADATTGSGGFGGAIMFEAGDTGTLTITHSTFDSNIAQSGTTSGGGFGGAIMFEPSAAGTATVTDSTFDSNTAQSGGSSGGGFGGALMFEPGGTGTLTITGSTFSSNAAAGSSSQGGFGGALMFEPAADPSSLSITNSTFTANQVGGHSGYGGGIMFEPNGATSSGTLIHVTIVGNSASGTDLGGGILVETATLTIRNSIVSGNTAAGTPNNCATSGGTLVAAGHNLELGVTCGFDLNADPNVEALAENGGPTKTMALTSGSPAIDAADDEGCPATDQRGISRPQGPHCDIGAYEFIAATATTTTSTLPTTTTTLPGACDVPAPTFASIDCRLDDLITQVQSATDLGKLENGLLKSLLRAREQKLAAEGLAATKKKLAKKRLKQAIRKMIGFNFRVRSLHARKTIPAPTRKSLGDQGTSIQKDMQALLSTL